MSTHGSLNVLVADKFDPECISGLEELGCKVHVDADLGPETLADAIKATEAHVLCVRSTKVPAEVINGVDSLKLIIRGGAGYDNIDTAAAGAKGVPVCNCPGMNAVAVAELAFGHILNLDRRIAQQTTELSGGHWNKKEFSKAKGLKGRKLLVVGMGSIGTEVCKRAQAFGMKVSAQSRSLREDTARALGIKLIPYTREALSAELSEADIVSVHVAATPDTKELCGPGFFAAMKDGAYFVNTSRGEIVDEQELIKAIKTKGIRAGLDVYQDQPSSKDTDWQPEIASIPGVSLTHHVGASTEQAQLAVGEETVRIVGQFMESGEALHIVNAKELNGSVPQTA
ncbi:MAG: NAD(P)-dependent oxidoreductase [Phycisphaerales bacterium JB052]